MDSFEPFDWPPMRLLFFLTFTGVFFYRRFPRPEWRWFLGLPLYWAYILLFYFGYAGMMTAGLSDLLKDRLVDQASIETPMTITSLVLLLLYRVFSRYSRSDESTEWAVEFIKGIITTYIALVGVFFAFAEYVNAPRLELFSQSWTAYATLLVCVGLDFTLWRTTRYSVVRQTTERV